MSQWESKYREKIRKGYVDQTDLVSDLIIEEKKNTGFKEIENRVIAEIVERLQKMAKQTIIQNYNISSDKVTQAMVNEAQECIEGLLKITDLDSFNKSLLNLFTVIPRKMGNVKDHLASSKLDFSKIIQKEQDLLDVMKGQVHQKEVVEQSNDVKCSDKTILDSLGLVFEECNEKDIITIKKCLGLCSNQFLNA